MSCCPQKEINDSIFRFDDTDAFDQDFIIINPKIPEGWVISKAVWRAGSIIKEFPNPIFPIKVSLNHEETGQLQSINTCYLAVYDTQGRKQTCLGSLKFMSQAEVV